MGNHPTKQKNHGTKFRRRTDRHSDFAQLKLVVIRIITSLAPRRYRLIDREDKMRTYVRFEADQQDGPEHGLLESLSPLYLHILMSTSNLLVPYLGPKNSHVSHIFFSDPPVGTLMQMSPNNLVHGLIYKTTCPL